MEVELFHKIPVCTWRQRRSKIWSKSASGRSRSASLCEIAKAHSEGLSIRKIAEATGLSSSRVHQLLHTDEARQIPDWLNDLPDSKIEMNAQSDGEGKLSLKKLQQQLADEGEVIGWCIGWLEQLARGEKVIVNLRASSDPRTAYVGVERSWVMRVLKRIAANLDQLSGTLSPTSETEVEPNPIIAGVKRRHRLAEPEPELSSLSQREQRAILREKMGLPPM